MTSSTIHTYAQLVSHIFLDFIKNQEYELTDKTCLTNTTDPTVIALKAGHTVEISQIEDNQLKFELTKNNGRTKWIYIMDFIPNETNFKFPVEFDDLKKSGLKDIYMTMGYNFDNFFDDLKQSVNYLEFEATTAMKLDFTKVSNDDEKDQNSSQLKELESDAIPPISKAEAKLQTPILSNILQQEYASTKRENPIPDSLAPPKFDDEFQIQSSPSANTNNNNRSPELGSNDLYPGGVKYPDLKPHLDPLRVGPQGGSGFEGGGMHPTANDPLFDRTGGLRSDNNNGLRLGGRGGIRYDDPMLGPNDDIDLIGGGLPGNMGLGGRGGGNFRGGNGGFGGSGFGGGSGGGFPGGL